MATIRKLQSKKFLAEVRKSGQYKSKTFTSKVQAMSWAVETEQSFLSDTLVRGKTLSDLFERYRDDVSPHKKSWRTECNRLNKFMRHPLAATLLEDIRQTHFDVWIEEELTRLKSSSVNRDLNLLSSTFEQGKRWQWTDSNPVRGIKRPRNPQPRDRRISESEIKRIKSALLFDGVTVKEQRHEIAIAFLFALETAMRQGEIWGMKWQDVYLEKRFVRLHETKNGTKRDVPLSTEAIKLLNLLNSRAGSSKVFVTNQNSSATIFRRSLKLAGIKELTFHDTRHEALTRLARKLDVLDLARMVGHRDPRSLMIYYNATAEEIAGRLG
jgi:integrase